MGKLDNYLMKPQEVEGIGNVYPIGFLEHEEFSKLANNYIVLTMPKRNNQLAQQWEKLTEEGHIPRSEKFKRLEFKDIFSWIVAVFKLEQDKREKNLRMIERKELLKDKGKLSEMMDKYGVDGVEFIKAYEVEKLESDNILELFKYTVKKEVIFNGESFDIVQEGEVIGSINSDNFDEYRDLVMNQNILHEPRIAPNLKSQAAIDQAIKRKFGDEESSLESMIAFVCSDGADISNYTYYRLRADFMAKMNKLNYITTAIFASQGAKTKGGGDIEITNVTAPFNLDKNPYADLMKVAKRTKLDEVLTK